MKFVKGLETVEKLKIILRVEKNIFF